MGNLGPLTQPKTAPLFSRVRQGKDSDSESEKPKEPREKEPPEEPKKTEVEDYLKEPVETRPKLPKLLVTLLSQFFWLKPPVKIPK